jgi:long-chain acyl-CoA synthetase
VAIIATGSAEYLAVALGALRTGVVPVLLNPALLAHEQQALLRDAEPALVLRDPDLADLLGRDRPADLADAPLSRPMLYTSGTTGTPKGVWTGVLAEDEAQALLDEEREQWGFEAGDVHIVASPLHHSAPLRFAGGTLLAGGTVVLPGPFAAERFVAAVEAQRPTTAFVVPAHLQRLLSLPRGPNLSSFRLLAHAGSPCRERLKRAALEAFPEGTVWEFYGSTEAQFTACGPDEWLERPGTVGRARAGRTLTTDEDGQIWCTLPSHARFEYWRDPEKTAAARRGDAVTVGDLGRLDDGGYLFLEGRRSDLVISGGVNVYPLEVEAELRGHPDVDDVAVFGVDDEQWGQRVCAAVVGAVTPDEVMAWSRDRLAPHKRPKQVVVLDQLPRNSMGKVVRSELPALLARQRAQPE